MRVEEFSMLVDEHARAWEEFTRADCSPLGDPGRYWKLEEAREQSRALVDAFRAALSHQTEPKHE